MYEYYGLKKLYKNAYRNKNQFNNLHQSDSEIIKIKNGYLLIKTDGLEFEAQSGLYKSPFTWGYMAVANSASDVLLNGGLPLGFVSCLQWPKKFPNTSKTKCLQGLAKASKDLKIPLLGGDIGVSNSICLSTTTISICDTQPLTRIGGKSGDYVIGVGKNLGLGSLISSSYLLKKKYHHLEKKFRPHLNYETNSLAAKMSLACIDSSDGIYKSLEILCDLNKYHIDIFLSQNDIQSWIRKNLNSFTVPWQYAIECDLGDLHSLYVVPNKNKDRFLKKIPSSYLIGQITNASRTNRVKYLNNYQSNYRFFIQIIKKNDNHYFKSFLKWKNQY